MEYSSLDYDIILFDLDGTVTDSAEGITRCVQYSAEAMGLPVPDLEELNIFVGPPLKEMFMEYFGLDAKKGEEAVKHYRKRYEEKGMYENSVYNGMLEVLKALKQAGKTVALATSKPEVFAKGILDHFGLTKYFDYIGGSTLNGERNTKAKVINYVLEGLGVENKERAVMIGDRKYDILGAKEAGISSVGVLYGYGSFEELALSHPNHMCEKARDLLELCSVAV